MDRSVGLKVDQIALTRVAAMLYLQPVKVVATLTNQTADFFRILVLMLKLPAQVIVLVELILKSGLNVALYPLYLIESVLGRLETTVRMLCALMRSHQQANLHVMLILLIHVLSSIHANKNLVQITLPQQLMRNV